MSNKFSYFKPKRNNSNFSFLDDKSSFSDKGVFIEGIDGSVDQGLLFDKLIQASHFKDKPKKAAEEAASSPLLISESDINEPKIIEDFYYKDYLFFTTEWEIPKSDFNRIRLEESTLLKETKTDATRVDPLVYTSPPQKSIKNFRVVFNRRTGGDIYTWPSFSGKIDVPNKRATFCLKFPYTAEGVKESKPEDELDPFLPTYTTAEFDLEKGFDESTKTRKTLALYVESENFLPFLTFVNALFVGEGNRNDAFISSRFDYYSYLFGVAYQRNKLSQVSIDDDLQLLRNFYTIIPNGCYRKIDDQQLAFDLGKFLASDKDSWFSDESRIMIDILKNANDLSNVYKALYNQGAFVQELYAYISDDWSHNEYLGFLLLLAGLYQEPQDENQLPVIPFGKKGGDDGYNFFIKAHNDLNEAPPVEESDKGNKILIQVVHIYKEEDPDEPGRMILNNRLVVNEYFNPMQLVKLRDLNENGEDQVICAIHLKRIAEQDSAALLMQAFVVFINIISILISFGIIARGAVGLIRLFALMDIAVSSTDILMQNKDFKQYLINSGALGAWLVDNWTVLSLMTVSATISLELVEKFSKNADEIIEIVSNAPKSKFPKESLDEVVNEMESLKKEADKLVNQKIDNFINRGVKNGKKIGDISKKIIVRELRNVTSKSTEVARALDKGKIKLEKLDEKEFFDKIKEPGEKLEDLKNVNAAQIKDVIYLKNSTSLDKAFGEIVHEGQHALDELNKLIEDMPQLRKDTKLITHDKVSMQSYVDKMTDKQVIELRARIAEREFQMAAKQNLDFNSVEAMISFIFRTY